MVSTPSIDIPPVRPAITQALREHWGLFTIEGIALVVLGVLALLVPVFATLAVTVLFGWLLLIGGGIGLVTTIKARRAPGFLWSLLSAIVGIVAGALLLGWPVAGTFSLTVVLIAFLLAEGVVSMLYALEHRKGFTGRWGLMLASGIIDLVLGAILFAGLPAISLMALGIFLGINMIVGGAALIGMALYARSETDAVGQ